METIKKGTIQTKTEDSIFINDGRIADIIKNALTDKGFCLTVRIVKNDNSMFIGEEIEIFREG